MTSWVFEYEVLFSEMKMGEMKKRIICELNWHDRDTVISSKIECTLDRYYFTLILICHTASWSPRYLPCPPQHSTASSDSNLYQSTPPSFQLIFFLEWISSTGDFGGTSGGVLFFLLARIIEEMRKEGININSHCSFRYTGVVAFLDYDFRTHGSIMPDASVRQIKEQRL